MQQVGWIKPIFVRSLFAAALAAGVAAPTLVLAQARPAPAAAAAPAAPVATDRDLEATQVELIRLLRLSPTLTTVVEHDPSLLSNQEYVNRNNPQLGQFLASHPEVGRNPEFYLFTHLNTEGGRDNALERAVWPESHPWREPSPADRIMDALVPFLVFLGVLFAVLWLVRQFLENRRWSRIFKLQTDVHSKLIERFGSSQELLTYMGTEAGKRFLEAAPIPVGLEGEQRMPNAVARVLNPLQIGVVLTLLGVGLLSLKNSLGVDMTAPMLLMGTVVLMPGIGFILSAGITWLLAGRLGLMPENLGAAGRACRTIQGSSGEWERPAFPVDALEGPLAMRWEIVMENVATGEARLAAELPMDNDAFAGFYSRSARPLWAYLARVSGDTALADDLMQESYVRFLCAARPLDGEVAGRRYLFRIATNLLKDHWRRASSTSIEDIPEERFAVSAGAEQFEAQSLLGPALAAMRPRDRQLLWLAYAEGYSHHEIAEVTGLASASIRLLLFRARRRIARLLRERMDGGRAQ